MLINKYKVFLVVFIVVFKILFGNIMEGINVLSSIYSVFCFNFDF